MRLPVQYSREELAELQFDVAISCLSADELFARKLYEILKVKLREVFLYSERQKELVGQEGVVLFATVFKRRSRVVVVLYRDGWGRTKWTGVESRAIQDFFLDGGSGRVLLYRMDDSLPPDWVPSTYIYASKTIPVESFAEVISFRARETGAEPPERDPIALARASSMRIEASARIESMRRSSQAVARAVNEVESIFGRMAELAELLAVDSPNLARFIRVGKRDGAVQTSLASVGYLWRNNVVNSVAGGELQLVVSNSSAVVAMQQGVGIVSRESFEFWPVPDETGWIWRSKGGLERTSKEMAEEAVRTLIQAHERFSLRRK